MNRNMDDEKKSDRQTVRETAFWTERRAGRMFRRKSLACWKVIWGRMGKTMSRRR